MKNLKKVLAVTLILALCFCMAACGGDKQEESSGGDGDVYELAACWVAGENTAIVQSWYKFKDKIEEESGGRIKVTTYHTGQVSSSDRENAEKVASNICQFTTIPMATMAEFSGIKEYNVSTIPFVCTSDAQLDYVFDQGIYDELNAQFLEKTGMRVNGSFSTGWIALGMLKDEVTSPDQLKGKKIRSMSTDGQLLTLEAWGAAPTPMAIGELYTGLQQGTVEGALAAEQLFDSEGYGEILGSVTNINPFSTYHMGIVNQEWYESLPEDLQKVFDDCMEYYYEVCREAQLKATEDAYANLEDAGCKFINLTDEQRDAFAQAASSVVDKMSNDIGADFVKKVQDCVAEMK